MPTNYSGRLTAILVILLICLFGIPGVGPGIFSWSTIFSSMPFSEKVYLKPGIDIAGGTSLTYEIKPPPGYVQTGSETLAEQMAQVLKKRVDPLGVRNLVWRPQGNDRLEIQLPRSAASGEKEKAQQAYAAAIDEIKTNNVNAEEVRRAVETLKGEARDKRLAELAKGSKSRAELFAELTKLYDTIQVKKAALAAANAGKDEQAIKAAVDAQAEAELPYEALTKKDNLTQADPLAKKLESTNLTAQELQNAFDIEDPKLRDQKVAELKARFTDFPPAIAAIDHFKSAYLGGFQKFKNSLDDATDMKALLKGSGVLEFHVLAEGAEIASPQAQEMFRRLQEKGPVGEANDQFRWYTVDPDRAKEIRAEVQKYNGKNYVLGWTTKEKEMVHDRDSAPWALLKAKKGQQDFSSVVEFEFDQLGGALFNKLTSANIHRSMAIVLDDKVISAPDINSPIGANGVITGGKRGGFDAKELDYLVKTLNAGSLPARLDDEPISERSITPQLGADNLRAGLTASVIGLVVVAIFLITYYHLAGIVAFFAVVMNLIIILGVLAMFGATFTLPSIAGIVLTVGTAVDANVLIFERLREEQHRGLGLKSALRNAYDRAWHAIFDSNMTTAITSACLYWFGSEEVRGFGLTLLIGIISSMFTALFVTKTIFAILIDKYGVKNLGSLPNSFPKWDKLLKPNIDWMKYIWPFIIFSILFITIGLSAFVIKKREMFDIEFASGTSVEFELVQNMPLAKVRDMLGEKQHELPSVSIVGINGREDLYQLVTPNQNAEQVKDAVVATLKTALKVQLPSKFDLAGSPIEQARSLSAALPVDKDLMKIGDVAVDKAGDHVNGVALVLRHLDPPISPNDIRNRIARATFQATNLGPNVNLSRWQIDVVRLDDDHTAEGINRPATDAVVLVSDPNFPYNKSVRDWTENLANPAWRVVNDGIGRPATLRNVSAFNPQVAASVQHSALMATGLSIIFIMAFIWLRFGNLKYGTATVVALVHDTLAVVGAIGMTHFIGGTAFGKALLIYEPFRMNLTLVAAVLTIMGYSMIDTIVVFDRVRENRGKYGHVSRKVINDSINQTLSRTLLTAGTTMIMVGIMYICGGPGIHGFTFVLLVGILIGTYSSIAVAAPLLLVGKDVDKGPTESANQRQIGQTNRVAELGTVTKQVVTRRER